MKKESPSKEKLIELLLFIRHKETEKPLNEMDNDLITACTELLLDLQNKKVTLSPEEIEERVKKITFIETIDTKAVKTKRRTNKKRILLIAAIIAILVAILCLFSTASEWNLYDLLLIEKFGRVPNAPTGVEFYENGVSYGVIGPTKGYDSFEEWAENENPDILLPKKFPESFTLHEISVGVKGKCQVTIISFNNGTSSYKVTHNAPIHQDVLDNVTPITIGNTKVYIEDLSDVNQYQVHFAYKGDYYYIFSSDKQPVLEILENLEVYL